MSCATAIIQPWVFCPSMHDFVCCVTCGVASNATGTGLGVRMLARKDSAPVLATQLFSYVDPDGNSSFDGNMRKLPIDCDAGELIDFDTNKSCCGDNICSAVSPAWSTAPSS